MCGNEKEPEKTSLRAGENNSKPNERKSFEVNYNRARGFKITFPNGIVLSTQFGMTNYCENRETYISNKENIQNSNDAEVAIWHKDNPDEWLTREMYKDVFGSELCDDVIGYINIAEWLEIFEWCKNYRKQ